MYDLEAKCFRRKEQLYMSVGKHLEDDRYIFISELQWGLKFRIVLVSGLSI